MVQKFVRPVRFLKLFRSRASATNHLHPVAGALDLPDIDLPLDPYLTGCFLGDGTAHNGQITTGVRADHEAFCKIFADAGAKVISESVQGNCWSLRLNTTDEEPDFPEEEKCVVPDWQESRASSETESYYLRGPTWDASYKNDGDVRVKNIPLRTSPGDFCSHSSINEHDRQQAFSTGIPERIVRPAPALLRFSWTRTAVGPGAARSNFPKNTNESLADGVLNFPLGWARSLSSPKESG